MAESYKQSYAKQMYWYYKNLGICTTCHNEPARTRKDGLPGTECESCHQKNRIRTAEYRKIAIEKGYCSRCLRPKDICKCDDRYMTYKRLAELGTVASFKKGQLAKDKGIIGKGQHCKYKLTYRNGLSIEFNSLDEVVIIEKS